MNFFVKDYDKWADVCPNGYPQACECDDPSCKEIEAWEYTRFAENLCTLNGKKMSS